MGLIKRSIFLFAVVCALSAPSVLANTVYVPFLDSPPIRQTNTYISVGPPTVLVTYNAATQTFIGYGKYTDPTYGANVVTESVTQDGLTGANQYGKFSFSIHVDAVGAIDDRSSFLMTDLTGSTVYFKSDNLLRFGFQQKTANTGQYDFYMKFAQTGPSVLGLLPGRNFAANILGGTLNYTGPASGLFTSSFDTTIGYKADVFPTPLPGAAVGGAGLLAAIAGLPLLRRKRAAA